MFAGSTWGSKVNPGKGSDADEVNPEVTEVDKGEGDEAVDEVDDDDIDDSAVEISADFDDFTEDDGDDAEEDEEDEVFNVWQWNKSNVIRAKNTMIDKFMVNFMLITE